MVAGAGLRTVAAYCGLAVGALCLMGGFNPVMAAYPDHPINMIVPWGAGGGADLLGRTAGKIMAKSLNVSIPVINVPGATGMTGMTKLLTAPADGYTMAILIGDTTALLTKPNPPFKLSQIIPLAVMIQQPSGFWVNANSPYKTWRDLEKAAKTKTLKVATLGFGSADDITTRYLIHKLGLKLEEVPYSHPGMRYSSILGGNADVLYEQTGDVRSYFDAGKIRPLIFFYPHSVNIPVFAKVPVSKSLGLNVTLPQFRAIVVKAGTPPDRVKMLSDALRKVSETPDFAAYIKQEYADPHSYISMDGAGKFMEGWLRQAMATIERSK
jgi:tripartite-type tricarboxylate transporter receptor subunit TctC